jgi:hypothetical protein
MITGHYMSMTTGRQIANRIDLIMYMLCRADAALPHSESSTNFESSGLLSAHRMSNDEGILAKQPTLHL